MIISEKDQRLLMILTGHSNDNEPSTKPENQPAIRPDSDPISVPLPDNKPDKQDLSPVVQQLASLLYSILSEFVDPSGRQPKPLHPFGARQYKNKNFGKDGFHDLSAV